MDRASLFENVRRYFAKDPSVIRVLAFGSFATGTSTRRSDLDLVVVKETQERFMDRLTRNYLDLDSAVGVPVDLLVYTPAEWERQRRRLFFSQARMEVIL